MGPPCIVDKIYPYGLSAKKVLIRIQQPNSNRVSIRSILGVSHDESLPKIEAKIQNDFATMRKLCEILHICFECSKWEASSVFLQYPFGHCKLVFGCLGMAYTSRRLQ